MDDEFAAILNKDAEDIEMPEAADVDTPNSGMAEDAQVFQREFWQFRTFPYYKELCHDADFYFSHIKTGLAHSILHRDARPGLLYWVYELDRFIQSYSLRFTKEDHINIVKLLYSALTMPKLEYGIVKMLATALTTLLSRKNMLTRADLILEWRPLFDLYMDIHKNLEEDGILLPENLKKTVCNAIFECNLFFNESATQEILNEARPLICPWDDSTILAFSIMRVFLPTALTPAQHDEFGASLWFEELWHWFQTNDNTSSLTIGEKILSVFARLAKDCPGYIDWTDKYDVLFTKVLRSFKLEVGTDRVMLTSATKIFTSATQLLVYCIGGENDSVLQGYFGQLFATCESYFYPSNYGAHTANLLTFMHLLCSNLVYRVSRERHRANRYVQKIPESMKITDQQIDAFVKMLLPSLRYAAFSKTKHELVPAIMRLLAFLSPGIIVPAVLDLVYPALEIVTEPHRLTQSLHILSCICIPLVRDDASKSPNSERHTLRSMEDDTPVSLKSYRRHALTILVNLLPGIDVNDISKTLLTFQIVGLLLLLIPTVDCSEAVLVRSDLTDEEKELCSATACFDSFVEQLLTRIFGMIELIGHSVQISHTGEHQNLTKGKIKSIEEYVIEKGVLTVFKSLINNCSTAIYTGICRKFFEFLRETVFDSKPAMDTMTRMVMTVVANHPSFAFPLFFNFASEKLHKILTDEVCEEEEVDTHVIWYLTLVTEIIRGTPGTVLAENRAKIEDVLRLVMRCKAKDAFNLVATVGQNILHSLCSTYPIPKIRREIYDQTFDQYLPIRDWALVVDKHSWSVNWHIPCAEERAFVEDLVEYLIFDNLKVLSNPDSLKDNEILKALTVLYSALEGCSNLCPYFSGEFVSLMPSVTPNVHFPTTILPPSVKELTTKSGGNVRDAIYLEIKKLADYLLTKRENNTKLTLMLVNVMKVLMHVRGIDAASFQAQFSTFQMTKRIMSDPVRGNSRIVEPIMEGIIAFMHAKRLLAKPLIGLTYTHLDAMKLLMRLGTSTYSSVRMEAQKALDTSLAWWSFSYKLILDDLLKLLTSYDSSKHQQFKGALYILLNSKHMSLCVRQDWETLNKIWPTLVKAHFSEKASIITLFDTAQDIIVGNLSSFQVEYHFPDSIMPFAKKLLEPYAGCVHRPVWPNLTFAVIEEGKKLEVARNEKNKKLYHQLCDQLLQLATDKTLHWRHVELAEVFLSLLFRRDVPFKNDVVLLFLKLLVSDVLKTRKTATSLIASWLKANKPKAIKREHPFEVKPSAANSPNAKWPIPYGYRKDNEMLLYTSEKQPKTAEAWNTARFFFKVHFGYYTWPTVFKSYAPISEQLNANRLEFTQLEKQMIACLSDDAFLDKLFAYMSLEEKKGHEEFSSTYFGLFYRIFRNFNDALLPSIRQRLEKLLENKREGSQRLASEIVAGFACGSKLWTFERASLMWEWLKPRLTAALENIDAESLPNWGTALASVCGMCEARQVGWLLDLLRELICKPCDNNFHATSRLYLFLCAVNQFEWRIPAIWRELYTICVQQFDNVFQNMRYRAASCIASSNVLYLPPTYVDPDLKKKLALVSFKEVLERISPELEVLTRSALKNFQGVQTTAVGPCTSSISSTNTVVENKKEKLVLMTLIDLVYVLSIQPLNTISNIDGVYQLIPVLAHYSYDTNSSDEELRNSCQSLLIRSLGTGPIGHEHAQTVIDLCVMIGKNCCWWKTNLGMLRFLQVFAFSNLYIMRPHRATVQRLCLDLINDMQVEVRNAAAETLSGLIHCAYLPVDHDMIGHVKLDLLSNDATKHHSAILTLSAIILAFPYSVPSFMPEVLMMIAKHLHGSQTIYATVKKTLSEFKRTHQDCWHEHKQEFTEEQLSVLTDILVSPNYYV